MPWDVAVVALQDGKTVFPALVMRPLPLPLIDEGDLREAYEGWRKQPSDAANTFDPAALTWKGWTSLTGDVWPEMAVMMANTDRACRTLDDLRSALTDGSPEGAEWEELASQVHWRCPWLPLVHPALVGITGHLLKSRETASGTDVLAQRMLAEDEGIWPPKRKGQWVPGVGAEAFCQWAALRVLRKHPKHRKVDGRWVASFVSGRTDRKKPLRELSASKAFSAVETRMADPWMQAMMVPFPLDVLPDEEGQWEQALAMWLFDGRGSKALDRMFGAQDRNLKFHSRVTLPSDPGVTVDGRAVLGLSDLAIFAPIKARDPSRQCGYLGWRLRFGRPRKRRVAHPPP